MLQVVPGHRRNRGGDSRLQLRQLHLVAAAIRAADAADARAAVGALAQGQLPLGPVDQAADVGDLGLRIHDAAVSSAVAVAAMVEADDRIATLHQRRHEPVDARPVAHGRIGIARRHRLQAPQAEAACMQHQWIAAIGFLIGQE